MPSFPSEIISNTPIAPSQNGQNGQMEFPHFASGMVVKGFGRGSKELGVPTANFPDSVVDELPEHFHGGVYYGWAQVNCVLILI